MSEPEQGQGAPAAPQKQPTSRTDRLYDWVDKLVRYGVYAAIGWFVAFVLLPGMWNRTIENWPGTLAALAAMGECGGLRCALDALGLAIKLMIFPFYAVGLALWVLLYKRHLRVAGIIGAVCLPVFAHVFMPGAFGYRLGFFLICFVLSTYLERTSNTANAGVVLLIGVSVGLMVVRLFLDRKGGA